VSFNINELDFSEIGSWPFAARIGLIVVVSVLVLLAGVWLDSKKQYEKLKQVQRQEADLRITFEQKQKEAASLPAYEKQLTEIKRSFVDLLMRLPSKSEIDAIVDEVSKEALMSGLKIVQVKPQPEIAKEFYVDTPIAFQMRGDYHQLGEFVSRVSNMERIINFDDFKIVEIKKDQNINAGGPLFMSILAHTYHYVTG